MRTNCSLGRPQAACSPQPQSPANKQRVVFTFHFSGCSASRGQTDWDAWTKVTEAGYSHQASPLSFVVVLELRITEGGGYDSSGHCRPSFYGPIGKGGKKSKDTGFRAAQLSALVTSVTSQTSVTSCLV